MELLTTNFKQQSLNRHVQKCKYCIRQLKRQLKQPLKYEINNLHRQVTDVIEAHRDIYWINARA